MRSSKRWVIPLGTAVVALLLALPAAAQTGTIQGTVTEQATQQPIVGAQISVQGTNLGTLTSQSGRFMIMNVPAGEQEVVVNVIGYSEQSQTVNVQPGQSVTANFEMRETAIALDEIVVTGTAAGARKREIGNSMASISEQALEVAPIKSSQNAIQGRAPGVAVMTNSGQVGAGYTVKIRGVNSVSQDTEPLIYVDGVRIFNLPVRSGWGSRTSTSPLQDIAGEDIARIEIVKGAAATTLYGTEASSGVIQIFTKRGYNGATQWSAEVGVSSRLQGDVVNMENPNNLFTECSGLMQGIDTGGSDEGTFEYFVDPTCPDDGDWWRTGWGNDYSASVRGGSENMNYYVSGNYSDNDGTLPTQSSTDGGVRGNFAFQPFDFLGFQLNTAYTQRSTRWVEDGNNSDGFLLNVGRGYRGYLKGGKFDECTESELQARYGNILPAGVTWGDVTCSSNEYLFESEMFTRQDHFTMGFNANFSPTDNWTNSFSVGWDYTFINSERTHPFGYIDDPLGYFWDENTKHTKLALEYAGTLRSELMDGQLALTTSWGGQFFRDQHRWIEVDVHEFAGPIEPTYEAGADIRWVGESLIGEATGGFFLQEQVGWNDLLYITAGMRMDGNSAFGDDFGFQFYPKLSGSWIASDHDFVPAFFSTLKIRGALGMSGKAPGAFDKLRTWAPETSGEGNPAFSPQVVGNEDLGPETTLEQELGFDAELLNGRLGIEFTQYWASTTDALVGVTLPPSLGWLGSQTQNIGRIDASGTELALTFGLVRTETVEWSARTHATWQTSEVVNLNGEEIFADNKAEFREGYPSPGYFGERVVNPNEVGAAPQVVNDTFIGPVYPTTMYSAGTTLRLFNRLTLDGLFEFQGGHYLPNYTGYQNARRGVWQPCYDIQQAANGVIDSAPYDNATALERARCDLDDYDSDFWVMPADFWKLRSLSLSYRLPQSLVRFGDNAVITIAGTNLLTFTDYTGTDPEVMDFADYGESVFDGTGDFGRRDYYQIPPPRMVTMSLRFSF